MSFSKGGIGLPCTPFFVFAAHLCCCLPTLLLLGGGGGPVYLGEMRCLGERVGCDRPDVLTYIGLALRHPGISLL